MTNSITTLDISTLADITAMEQATSLNSLEEGNVIFLPNYFFASSLESGLLTEKILDKKHKNISFNHLTQQLNGFNKDSDIPNLTEILSRFMNDYALFSKNLVTTLLPSYQKKIKWGRTSFRPAEIKNRAISKRKDDTRLHVDAFTATPVNGLRILRVFCNINPDHMPRIWNLGEPFSVVMRQFSHKIPAYRRWLAIMLKAIKITKSMRSPYDHYQLHLHDKMKLDDNYQAYVDKVTFNFPAYSSWLVFTDQASHAALGGQFLLEQTFYLPVSAMKSPELSPLKIWEKEKGFIHPVIL